MHKDIGAVPSMGDKAWRNAHAESLNGLIKNEYINFGSCQVSLPTARKQIAKWIALYNQDRPHGSLKNREPKKYETFLQGLAPEERTKMKINY